MRRPRLTCDSEGKPLRRLLVISKAGAVFAAIGVCIHGASYVGFARVNGAGLTRIKITQGALGMPFKNSPKSPGSHNAPKRRAAHYIKSLRPLATRLGLPATQVYADLRLRPHNWRANMAKTLALARCVNLCSSRALLILHRDRLIQDGHVCSLLANQRSAAMFAVVFACSMDPRHVARRDALLLRGLLSMLAEGFGGLSWARTWLRRPCSGLDGRTPRAAAADAVGFGAAARVLAAELKRRRSK